MTQGNGQQVKPSCGNCPFGVPEPGGKTVICKWGPPIAVCRVIEKKIIGPRGHQPQLAIQQVGYSFARMPRNELCYRHPAFAMKMVSAMPVAAAEQASEQAIAPSEGEDGKEGEAEGGEEKGTGT